MYQLLIEGVEVEGLIQKAGFLIRRGSETGSSSLDLPSDKTVTPKRCNLCIPWKPLSPDAAEVRKGRDAKVNTQD